MSGHGRQGRRERSTPSRRREPLMARDDRQNGEFTNPDRQDRHIATNEIYRGQHNQQSDIEMHPPNASNKPDDGQSPPEEGGVLQAVAEFATEISSAHGFPNVFKATSVIGRLLWAVIFLAALTAFTWQASVLIGRFLMRPVAVEIKIITKTELGFPAVTVCNTNKIRRSAIKQSRYRQALTIDDGETLPYYGPCISGDFMCASNDLCLKQFLRCDGINHCRDFSDESDCDYDACPSDEFKCSNGSSLGICISDSLRCNRKQDCYDGDDETDCPCKSAEFQCKRGGCIQKYRVCDGKADCVDGSDEKHCGVCSESNTNTFRCNYDGSCIPLGFVCDKADDCFDGEDETSEACALVTPPPISGPNCPPDEFDCGNITCIPNSWLCDKEIDCLLNAEDEAPYLCGRTEGGPVFGVQRCLSDRFLCKNQWQCVYIGDRCNLKADCFTDNILPADDEYNCTCEMRNIESLSSQKVKCLGFIASKADNLAYPYVDTRKFDSMECYNNNETDPTINSIFAWQDFVCQGNVLCTNGENDFPEPCEVFHECYIAPNAQDYRGRIGQTVSLTPCLDWNNNVSLSAGFSSEEYPELFQPLCRNPGGSRSTAWCFKEGAETEDDWELCDVGELSNTCHPGVELPVRLAGSLVNNGGRVEVMHNGSWGTVSDTSWTLEDANVVCKQLGFEAALSTNINFAASFGSVFISQVNCTGYESSLIDCRYHVVMATEEISHIHDVAVLCRGERTKRQAEEEFVPDYTAVNETCADNEFHCRYGGCIPYWMTCNGFPDCVDGSDETLSECSELENPCTVDEVPCRGDSQRCVERRYMCDSFADCLGGTDEQFCNDRTMDCPEGYFKCKKNGKCIHHFRVCDTVLDCLYGEDEECSESSHDNDDNGRLNPFKDGSWKDDYLDFFPKGVEEEYLEDFKNKFYTSRPFSRVLGEDPADWQRLLTFSEQPDYSDLSEVLKLSRRELSEYGHQGEDLVLQCSYDGLECSSRDFLQIQDEKYGNCYTFNYKHEAGMVRNSSRSGERSGLALTLFLEQDEYMSLYGREAGVRVSVTRPDIAPLPAIEGINVMPGTLTSVALKYNVILRKPDPFGECQVDKATVSQIVNGTIVQVQTDQYNHMHCLRVCRLQKILEICNCSDSFELDGERCKLLDAAQDLCKQMVDYLHAWHLLNCTCGSQCNDLLYSATVSQAAWPSVAFKKHLLRNIRYLNPKTKKIPSMEDIRKNLVRLKVFFQELNYQETKEVEDYPGTSLFGDIGGTIGLYIGFSLITFLEFFELLVFLIRTRCCRWTRTAPRQSYVN